MLVIHYNPLDLCLIAVYGQGFSLSLDVAFQAGCATAASKILKAVLSKGDRFPVLLAPFALTGGNGFCPFSLGGALQAHSHQDFLLKTFLMADGCHLPAGQNSEG